MKVSYRQNLLSTIGKRHQKQVKFFNLQKGVPANAGRAFAV